MRGKQCVGNKFPSLKSQVCCPPSIPLLNEKGDIDYSKLAQEYPAEEEASEKETSDPPLGTKKPVQEKVDPGEPVERTKDGTEKETMSGDLDSQDKAEGEIEGAVEKPIQESEVGAKSGEKPVQESDLELKEDEDGPKPLDPVQEKENPTVGSTLFDSMPQPLQDTENPKVDDQDKAEEEIESAVEKPIEESEIGAKSGDKPVQESELELKEDEDGPKPLDPVQEKENPTVGSTLFDSMPQPLQDTENPKVDDQDKAEEEIESAVEKPIEESEVGAKSGEKPVQESEDAGKKPAPETLCLEKSDLKLKEQDDGAKILDRFQEAENPVVGSTVEIKEENESVDESDKQDSMADSKMSEPVQETRNPDVGSAKKKKQAVSSADSLDVNKARVIEFHKTFCNKRWGVKERICKKLKRYTLGLL